LTLDSEQLLECLLDTFDTSSEPFVYVGANGEEVEVSEDTGLLLQQIILHLYGGSDVRYGDGEDESWD
jgi:hypothetical protein